MLADLGRKITTALRSLGNATVINEEVNTIAKIYIQVLSNSCCIIIMMHRNNHW